MPIYSLIKLGAKAHMEQFRETGKLYMLRLAEFQAMEDKVGRGDRDDGLSAFYQPNKVVVSWGGHTFEGLAGPVKVAHDITAQSHVFCLVALTEDHLEAHLRGEPMVPEESLGLGQHALVFTNVAQFIDRVKAAAARERLTLQAGLVEYVDGTTHHGEMGPFRKLTSYAHQSEWRILVPPSGERVYWLDLGCDLKDISIIVPADELNRGFNVSSVSG